MRIRASWSLLIVCLALATGFGARSMIMSENEGQLVAAMSATSPAQNQGPVTLGWWSRGGEPGPGYTSDKLDLQLQGNHARGTYIKARFDREYDPPFLSEQFAYTVPERLWRDLFEALEREKAFATHFVSEDRSNIADIIKDTIALTAGQRSQEKTFYGSEKTELPASKAARNAIAQYLHDRGERTIRSQKRKSN
jgi:hypothetical protein